MQLLREISGVALSLILVLHFAYACTFQPDSNPAQCEPRISSLFCNPLGPGNTSFPNILNHTTGVDAALYLERLPLRYSNCSQYLRYFLCTAVFPICVPGQFSRVEPCQELCTAVRESCVPELSQYSFSWPPELECSQFPLFGERICVWNNDQSSCGVSNPPPAETETTASGMTSTTLPNPTVSSNASGTTSSQGSNNSCSGQLVIYGNNSGAKFGGIENCGEPCSGVFLDEGEHNFALIWIATWSLVCLLVSIVTFLTYLFNFKKIPSPESTIYYVVICYIFVSLVYTVSIAVGESTLICDDEFTNDDNQTALVVDGIKFPMCGALFGILYYFTLCSWTWWAVLTIEWLLCSIKLTSIGYKLKLCFHIAAWGVPLVLLLTVLSLRLVSGNTVLRTCWISKHYELPFLIIPLLIIVVVCSVVIMLTFGRVVNLHQHYKMYNIARTDAMQVGTLVKVGLYCTVYLLPMGVLLCCYWYEFWFREQWEFWYVECRTTDCNSERGPLFSLFMTKVVASLIMGILSVLWAVKQSSALAWKRMLCVCQQKKTLRLESNLIDQFAEL